MHLTTIQENDDERKDLCATNLGDNTLKYEGANQRTPFAGMLQGGFFGFWIRPPHPIHNAQLAGDRFESVQASTAANSHL